MGAFDGIQGMVAGYLASPKGQETIRSFLSSPQGKEAIDSYLSTPDGQQMARLLLLRALDSLDIPEAVKGEIRTALAGAGA
ncbi:MAG: hypothetical protein ABSG28_04740 [Methanoregula sp.]|jgi:hypothetical protein|uniref:hypothetical protein n=1 Tax=Methanoregula sp. TaxID=2052170 RepID=UPI003C1DAB4C